MFNVFLVAFLVISFVLLPGILFAVDSDGHSIRDFIIGACAVPYVAVWSGLIVESFFVFKIEMITNPLLAILAVFSLILVGALLSSYPVIKLVDKLHE